jgi:hypothetical protein
LLTSLLLMLTARFDTSCSFSNQIIFVTQIKAPLSSAKGET